MVKSLNIFVLMVILFSGCTEETKNKIGHSIQNWTGSNGVVEIYSEGKIVRRFIKVGKLTTGRGTDDGTTRPFRYSYGYLDMNLDFKVNDDEKKKIYFEVSDYSTPYAFFENPID